SPAAGRRRGSRGVAAAARRAREGIEAMNALWAPPLARPAAWWASLAGHAWTVGATLYSHVRPPGPLWERPFSTCVEDPRLGPVRLRGLLLDLPRAHAVVVIVHGLAGSAESTYCARAARAAAAAGPPPPPPPPRP